MNYLILAMVMVGALEIAWAMAREFGLYESDPVAHVRDRHQKQG